NLHPDCDKNHSVHQSCMDKWRATAYNENDDDIKTARMPCWPARGLCCPYACIDPNKRGKYRSEKNTLDKAYTVFIATETLQETPKENKLTITEQVRAQATHFDDTIPENNKTCFTCFEESNDKDGIEGKKCRWVKITCTNGHTTTYCEDCLNRIEQIKAGDENPCACKQTNATTGKNCDRAYQQKDLDKATWQTNA
ncbi:MAG: hypothetical protein WCJ61_09110, partial [Paludibacter sp.]